jgi:hypothetical protein
MIIYKRESEMHFQSKYWYVLSRVYIDAARLLREASDSTKCLHDTYLCVKQRDSGQATVNVRQDAQRGSSHDAKQMY